MHLRTHKTQMDAFIVGAGPAGLASPIACALKGLSVHVADAMEPPIDKACCEGLLPDALQALAALGLDPIHDLNSNETHPLHGIRFFGDQGAVAEAPFSRPARGIRRTILHQFLLDRAIPLGVRLHWKHSVQHLESTPQSVLVRTNRETFRTRYLIGADGPRSRVANWARLTRAVLRSRRISLRQHYAIPPWSNFVEVYWSNNGQAYVPQVSPTQVCVSLVS